MAYPQVPEELAGLAGPPPGAPPSIMVGGGGPTPGPPIGPEAAAGPGAGLPPELMALGGGGPEGAPPGLPPEGGEEEAPRSELDILAEMRSLATEYMDVADDDIEKKDMAKALATIQGLLAKNQQETEAAAGTSPALKGMRKALSA